MGILNNIFGTQPNSDKLTDTINNPETFLVDVRTPGEFAGGSAKGATNIPLDSILFNIKSFENKKQIVVFCRSGNRSAQALSILNQDGIKQVINGGTWEDVASLQNK